MCMLCLCSVSALKGGIEVIVGTPGRILDLLNRGSLDLTQLDHVVLDEVDRMLDMGFADSVDQILQARFSQGTISRYMYGERK